MLHTTFAKLHEKGACVSGYRKLADSLGGVTKYGKDTPIPLSKIVESNGMDDALWCLRATAENAENFLITFACDCAERVLTHYETYYPDDQRPRQAIEAARRCLTDKSDAAANTAADAAHAAYAARAAAYAAARAVARAAAYAAARAAAYAAANTAAYAAAYAADAAAYATANTAAYAAEKEWQKQHFLELLEKF